MHGVANGEGIKLNSYKVRDEESKIGQKNSPTPIPRTSTSKQDDKNTNEEATSNKPSPILPQNRDLQFDETPPPVPPKNQVLQVLDLDTIVPLSSSSQGKDEPTHVDISEILHSKESPDNRLEESPYATIDKSKKTSKKNSDNEIDNPTLSRSASQETEFDRLLDRNESEKNLLEELSQHSDTPPSPPPSYKTDGSENSLSTDSKFKLQKNRVWPRAQYAMQQKGVVIFGAAAIVLGTSTALVYLQDKAKFITFFANSPLYIIVPIIAVASLLAISPMFLGIKQFVNTKEYQTQGKNADEVLDNVFRHQPEGKVIKSVRLEYSNGTHSNFVFNAWESKKGFVNIDEKVISKTNKIESVINNRPLFTALLTGVVAANIALPLLLYAEGGVNNIQKFYQNPLTNNIRLLPLIGLGIFALLAVYLGVHYYRKTNCTNLTYSEGKIDPKNVNEKFIEEIKRERTNVLGENHSKDAKCSSLTLEQVVVQSHNYPDLIYGVGR